MSYIDLTALLMTSPVVFISFCDSFHSTKSFCQINKLTMNCQQLISTCQNHIQYRDKNSKKIKTGGKNNT